MRKLLSVDPAHRTLMDEFVVLKEQVLQLTPAVKVTRPVASSCTSSWKKCWQASSANCSSARESESPSSC